MGDNQGGLGRLDAWHLPGGPVGPPAWWAATPNVAGRIGAGDGARGPLAREGGFSLDELCAGAPELRHCSLGWSS